MQLEITIPNWEKYNSKRKDGHNPWFRLYNDLPRSKSLHNLPVAAKWLFICLLCECSRNNRNCIELSLSWLSVESELTPSRVRVALELLQSRSMLSMVSEDFRQRNVALECRMKNKNKNKKENVEGVERKNLENSSELKPTVSFESYFSEFNDPVILEFLNRAKIKVDIARLWVKTYEDAGWVKQEILKMIAWLDANPTKKPKSNYARFIGSWLSRGWEYHRKHLQSNPAKKAENWDYIFGDEK